MFRHIRLANNFFLIFFKKKPTVTPSNTSKPKIKEELSSELMLKTKNV